MNRHKRYSLLVVMLASTLASAATEADVVLEWNDIMLNVLAEQSPADMAMSDALVAVFETKYHEPFWRPETAIAGGDTDGNDATRGDPSFAPFIATPCHPCYPSAHASTAYAAVAVLEQVYGRTGHSIVLSSEAVPGVVLKYSTFDEIAADIDDARVYGGIHFRFDQAAGARQGRRVGGYVYRNNLRRARSGRRARKPTSAGARALAESREAPLEAYSAPNGSQRLERRRLELERLHVKRLQARGRGGRFSVSLRMRSNDRVRIVRAVQTGRVTHRARRGRGGIRGERAHLIRKSGSGNQDSERYCDGYLFHMPALNIASPQY